jgi:PAS domain S-box-containing protein
VWGGSEVMRPEDLGIGKLFERVRDAVIVADAATQQIVLWNRAATEIFGYPLAEALEMPVEALIPEHLKGMHREGIVRYARTGHGLYIDSQELLELPAVRKGGGEIRIEMSLNPVGFPGEENGRFVLAIIRDITERKRGEEALRDAEAELRAVFGAMDDVIFVLDGEGRYLKVAPTHPSLLYRPADEVTGKTLREVLPSAQAEAILAGIRRVLETGRREAVEYDLDMGGRQLWFAMTISPMLEDSVVAVARNITERKRAEEEIRHLNETLEQRVALRTTQLAEREARLRTLLGKLVVAQEEERRRVAYEVHDGLAQMIVGVQQHLQAFARQHPPEDARGRESLAWNLSLIQQTVEEARRVIAGLRPTALDDFGLAVALRLQADTLRSEGWEIAYNERLGDERLSATLETALYRITQEALTNVRKHADTTHVSLSIGRLGQEVRLRVRDHGRGFGESEMVRAGGPGERVGISGMQERVALLGGTFQVLSRPGSGTLIVARVPFEGSGEDAQSG